MQTSKMLPTNTVLGEKITCWNCNKRDDVCSGATITFERRTQLYVQNMTEIVVFPHIYAPQKSVFYVRFNFVGSMDEDERVVLHCIYSC